MGRSVSLIPNPYTPHTARVMKDKLSDAIIATMEARQLRPADIHARYPSIRAGDIAKIRAGDGGLFGLNRLIAVAEAIGIPMSFEVRT